MTYQGRFSLTFIILPFLIWILLFNSYLLPFSLLIFNTCSLLALLLFGLLYREVHFSFDFSKRDFLVVGLLFLLSFLCHWPNLFVPLGGDELYHATRSAKFIVSLKEYFYQNLPPEDVSMWQLFSPARMQVWDVWRVLSLLMLILGMISVKVAKCFSTPMKKSIFISFFILGLLFLGTKVSGLPDPHPPLRTLPLFLGHLFFGLNDFAFRIPSLIFSVGLSTLFYFLAKKTEKNQHLFLAFLIQFIPIVFYVADAVEPSIYGFCTWSSTLLLCYLSLQKKEESHLFLIYAGIIVALGTLFRQTAVLLWMLVGLTYLFCWCRKDFPFQIKHFLQIFSLSLISLPYFYTVKQIGHPAVNADTVTKFKQIGHSVSSGIGPMTILNSTTLPWMIMVLLLFILAFKQDKGRTFFLCLFFVPAYAMFYSISDYLWGVGRYQAEYVAAFIVLLMFIAGQRNYSKFFQKFFLLFSFILALFTLDLNARLDLDTRYTIWPRMRITTTASLPYDSALTYIKKQEANGRFLLIGGQPWYGEMLLWLTGHSFEETYHWNQVQDQFFAQYLEQKNLPFNLSELRQYCLEKGIKYLLLQRGSKRELQHQTPKVSSLINDLLYKEEGRKLFFREASFVDKKSGVLEILKVL